MRGIFACHTPKNNNKEGADNGLLRATMRHLYK